MSWRVALCDNSAFLNTVRGYRVRTGVSPLSEEPYEIFKERSALGEGLANVREFVMLAALVLADGKPFGAPRLTGAPDYARKTAKLGPGQFR